METKICNICNTEKKLENFPKFGGRRCRKCRWIVRRKQLGIRDISIYQPFEKNGEMVRICTKCETEKKLTEFVKGKRFKHGVFSYCKSCVNDRVRKAKGSTNPPRPPKIVYVDKKPCADCKVEMPLSKFRRRILKNGSFSYNLRCHPCQNAKCRQNKTGIKRRLPFEIDGVLHKVCSKCETAKPLSDYAKDNSTKIGVTAQCKGCVSKLFYTPRPRPIPNYKDTQRCVECKSKKPLKKFQSRINKTMPMTYDKMCIACRARRHGYKYRQNRKVMLNNNPELKRLKNKKALIYQNKRRAIKENSPFVTEVSKDTIIKRDGLVCYLCGKVLTYKEVVLEHLIPLSRGGCHKPENIGISCKRCNSSKYNKTVTEFKKYRGDYLRFSLILK